MSNNGNTIRFNVEDSGNCVSGGNANRQQGTASTTITFGSTDVKFSSTLTGMGEGMDTGFDKLTIKFDSVVVGTAEAAGGGTACVSILSHKLSLVHGLECLLQGASILMKFSLTRRMVLTM